jgi:S-adenosyl-L-methionine hydrolase (adenosine-forming)
VTRCKQAVLVALVLAGCAHRPPPTIVFLSDFGTTDDSVAICKGVMLGIEPRLRLVDLTHDVRPFAIADAARLLAGTAPYYPAGTVFLAVVDPGVGVPRRALAVLSGRGQYFVVPDNGLITLVAARDGIREARELRADPASSTFHGRDVFAPAAARLAHGGRFADVGPVVASPTRIAVDVPAVDERGLAGAVIELDGPFGNLVTNVDAPAFRALGWQLGDAVPVTVGERTLRMPFVRTFGDVAVGEALLYVDSRGRLALAVNRGDFARRYGLAPPVALFIPRRPR